jgi:hypothetical protein
MAMLENNGGKTNALGYLCALLSGEAIYSEPIGHLCDCSKQVLGY